MTEPERHELYELAKHHVNDRFAELMISALPPEPSRLATKDDLAVLGAVLRAEMAELRAEMAELRGSLRADMAELRGSLRAEMRDLTSQQTRTLMIGLVLSITALAITQIVLATLA